MHKAEHFLARMTERLDLPPQVLGGETQVLFSGDRQVTVEGHRGIRLYSPARIEVRTKRFCVCVEGGGLCVSLLTRTHLVIRGSVRAVILEAAE